MKETPSEIIAAARALLAELRHTETSEFAASAEGAFGAATLLERRARKLKNAALRQARYRQTAKAIATKQRWLNDSGRAYKAKWMSQKRASSPKQIRPLTDGYVRSVLTSRSLIPPNKIPAEMVEAATANLKLKRLWQNRKT